ncbi:MAG: hydroxyacylglutathione hydrolase, partial [Mesorhizobium sp.]
MPVEIEQFMCRTDNFGVLVHDARSGQTAIIDAPEEAPILAAIKRTGWTPTMILTTHHHGDHVEANLALKERFKLTIVGPEAEQAKIPGIDETVSQGSVIRLGEEKIEVIETPGHTAGHVSYHLPASKVAFTADTLFALGCGRLFECKPPVMHESLKKLAALPAETVIYCGHEYTLANARFALTVDPSNSALKERAARIEKLRADNKP